MMYVLYRNFTEQRHKGENIDGIPTAELAESITRSGIEVDAIIDRSQGMTNVVVGHVLECVQHPDADKLRICQVDVGETTTQIICGAENIAQGQKVIVARPGAVLPGDFKIKAAKLRGEDSNLLLRASLFQKNMQKVFTFYQKMRLSVQMRLN